MCANSTNPSYRKRWVLYIDPVAKATWMAVAANIGVSASYMMNELAKVYPEYEDQLARLTEGKTPEERIKKIAEAAAK